VPGTTGLSHYLTAVVTYSLHSPRETGVLYIYIYIERESEREGSERHYRRGGGVGNNNFFVLMVPRHCPLVLLLRVRLEFRVN
jgi:hypothetical protein